MKLEKDMVRAGLSLILCLFVFSASAAAQQRDWDPRGTELTREELTTLLADLNSAGGSSAYSATLRQRSHAQAALVAERLEKGDFDVGDRILLYVENEPTMSDTFVVSSGRLLSLPIAGDIPLTGVLRSELRTYLKERIGQFVREPIVRVQSLVRLSLAGGIARPGFYVVPADTPLPDVLMLAGGPAVDGKMEAMRVDRGRERLLDGEAMRRATSQGRTIDQLNMRAGDEIVVPRRRSGTFGDIARYGGFFLGLPAAIYGISQLF